jgi:hypothetical protein
MKWLALPLLASLLLARDAPRGAGQRPIAVPVARSLVPATRAVMGEMEETAEPAPAPLPLLAPGIRETSAPVPADVEASVRPASAGAWSVRLARKGYFVAMRHGGARTAAANQATLVLAPGDAEQVVWETTKLDSLVTTRGTLAIDDAAAKPRARLRLADAPVPAGREERRLHTCAAHEDGAGGFTVLCRVRATPTVTNVTGTDANADVWVSGTVGSPVVRLDLPASPEGVEARMLGYAAGTDGVVVRAEASRVAGEDHAVLTLASADRGQPQVPRARIRYTCCFGTFRDL